MGDFDGDGALDIVAGNSWQQNRIYLNDGTGGFPTGVPFGGPDGTQSVVVGDLNGDGTLDIVAGNGWFYSGEQNKVYLNDGTGTFSAGIPLGDPDGER